jgi:PEP-CTERM motif
MKNSRHLSLAFALCAAVGSAQAAPLFAEDFESSAGLANGNWTTNLHGFIANDPLNAGNHAVAFSGIQGGGDLWSLSLAGGNYTLSFDVLGTCSNGTPANCGAFIGINDSLGEHWLAGDATYASPHLMQTNGSWQHVSFSFTAVGAFRLKMEDFNGQPRDIFFDNICISGTAGDSSCPSNTRNETPEPGSLALAGLALAGLGLARRKRTQAR